jgi:RNA polymerase sigma-70 factor (ECF subfamily)
LKRFFGRKKKLKIEDIFSEFNELIFKFILARVLNKEIAEDLTSDVFTKVLKNLENFDDSKSALKTWIYNIAKNTLIDFFRTNSKYKSQVLDFDFEQKSDFKNEIDNELNLNFILNKMNELKDKEKVLITLRYLNNHSVEEVSKITNKSYESTKVGIHRAILKLKKLINGEN